MADLAFTAAQIRPSHKTIVNQYAAGSALGVGDAVFMGSDGAIDPSDPSAAASAQAIGIVVAIGAKGALTAVAGDQCDVVQNGLVEGFTGLTPGDLVYISATAGNMADAAPAATNYKWIIGQVMSATSIWVNPFTDDLVVLS
jgi:hypothetical protein